ncbi:MAG: hypothetical protein CVT47_00115 [Thermoplasmata archaeon HGW-Thermoplasmata-2]|nr:MAG: hypothetical protein CVT47_00115 [Thermoplasmata archaeon HGW-Thermoplasmata-2]
MKTKALLVSLPIALLCGFSILILVTALLDKIIWPSLFAGIPAGIIGGIIAFFALKRIFKRMESR